LERESLQERLRGKLFLSSMMGYTDGQFCGERGKGCAMVQLGAYLSEPLAYGVADSVLPPTHRDCVQFLQDEFDQVRQKLPDAKICVNIATPKLEWAITAAEYVAEAGGIFELNIHGGYEPYLREGKIRAMVLPENRSELFEWLDALSRRLESPIIVKFREGIVDDYMPILERLAGLRLMGIHFNIRDDRTGRPDFAFVEELRKQYRFFLLVSGFIRSPHDAQRLFLAGADMVGIGEPTIQDQDYIKRIAEGI
jgi:tRNA-dihydrouridine synthase